MMNFNVARASSGVARKILQPTNYATCSAAAAAAKSITKKGLNKNVARFVSLPSRLSITGCAYRAELILGR